MKTGGEEFSPLVHFKKKYNCNGKPHKTDFIQHCDAFYCELAIDRIKAEIEQRKNGIIALEKILKEENERKIIKAR